VMKQVDISHVKDLKVVVDAGNGMGGPAWDTIRTMIPVEIVPLYLVPDGTFPHHVADPSKDENLHDLVAKVKETNADFGIAIDGDADRAVFVDNNGKRVIGTVLVAMLAEYFLSYEKGVCMYDATCGRIVKEVIEINGGTAYRSRVGHSIIKTKIKELHAIFAGENSGHFYFPENCNAESSLMAGLIMMKIVFGKKEKMSEIVKKYDMYPRSGEISFKVPDAKPIIEALRTKYASMTTSIDELDGVSFWFKDWWFNVRLSKTEPLMRLNIETNTQSILDAHMGEIITLITEHGGVRK
jgi:phosphomannomutase